MNPSNLLQYAAPATAAVAVLAMTLAPHGSDAATKQPQTPPSAAPAAKPTPPPLRREFRGVWVATVANIDWPTKPGLPVEQQKAELVAMFDRFQKLGLNAVVFQIRPACDALYPSTLEPWSEYLTGEMGKAPEPFYDPLQFAIEEAHKRGLELHTWFNPYRARQAGAPADAAIHPTHLIRRRPDLAKKYGKSYWLDPGEPEVQQHSLNVILDVVRRYDVDGVHIDDYFYPYKEKGADGTILDFPDEPSYKKYVAGGGKLTRNDLRRENVNKFVEGMYKRVKAEKPWVKVGISPFGLGRPGRQPAQIRGFDQYEELYADAQKWWDAGWCDYFAPQLYWPIAQTPQSFPVLLGYWAGENTKGRHLWPGQYTSRAGEVGKGGLWSPQEIEFQVKTARGMAGATGTIHFSAKSMLSDDPATVGPHLAANVYQEPALIPASPWLAPAGSKPPAAPIGLDVVKNGGGASTLTWKAGGGDAAAAAERAAQWVVQAKVGDTWTSAVLSGAASSWALPAGAEYVSVFAVDRYGAAGAPGALDVTQVKTAQANPSGRRK